MKTAFAIALACGLAAGAGAEPVQITGDSGEGFGYSVRRGGSCYVITAWHVVQQPGAEIRVADRSSATSAGEPVFENEQTDLALLKLPDKTPVACKDTWEEPQWLAEKRFTPKDEFTITNQTSTGKETIFLYRYAGGSEQELELAPKEKLRIKQTDSGSPVFFDERIVGIVVRVNKENDRVTVLRAPTIDDRLGQILRGRGVAERNILFTGVLYRKRPVDDWSVHARTELASAGLGTILVADPTGRSCALSANVVAIAARNEANPQYAQTEANYKSMCGRDRGGFAKYLCDSQRQSLQTMPRTVSVWTIEVDVSAKAPQGAGTSQLGSYRFSADPKEPRDAVQRSLIGKAVAATAKELITSGACE